MVEKFQKQEHKNTKTQNQAPSKSYKALIRLKWPRLTDEEIDSFVTEPRKFCNAVKTEYGISQEELDRQLNLMEREAHYAA